MTDNAGRHPRPTMIHLTHQGAQRALIASLALSLTACTTQFGHDFNGAGLTGLTPGVSSRDETLAILNGTAESSEVSTWRKDPRGKALPVPIVLEERYYYFRDTRAPTSQTSMDKEAKRYGWVYFSGNTLLGYITSSTFAQDSTDFNESQARQLRKGRTTQQDTLALLGTPAGKALYPICHTPDCSRWYYRLRWWANQKMNAKMLTIDFNKEQVVTDFDLHIGED